MHDDLAVEIRNISLRRGKTQVFDKFSWKVKNGENWFIMGNNGCGKTSLFEIIMGYLWPQDGSVRVLGKQFGKVFIPELRKQIGYVSPWIFQRMPVSTSVCNVVVSGLDGSAGYWGKISDEMRNRALKKLEIFQCSDLIDRKFGTLSSGQQFKVILARAIINDPELLLLDEPFSQLDIGSRIKAYSLVEQLSETHDIKSTILITHHLEDIIGIFTHGLLFRDGKNYISGSRKKVLSKEVFNGIFDIPA